MSSWLKVRPPSTFHLQRAFLFHHQNNRRVQRVPFSVATQNNLRWQSDRPNTVNSQGKANSGMIVSKDLNLVALHVMQRKQAALCEKAREDVLITGGPGACLNTNKIHNLSWQTYPALHSVSWTEKWQHVCRLLCSSDHQTKLAKVKNVLSRRKLSDKICLVWNELWSCCHQECLTALNIFIFNNSKTLYSFFIDKRDFCAKILKIKKTTSFCNFLWTNVKLTNMKHKERVPPRPPPNKNK